MKCGRRRAHENENLAPLLDELIARHSDSTRHVLVADACFLAHSTGMYARCVELFSSCARESSLEMQLHECVVDSCFHLGEAAFLRRLFDVVDLMAVRLRRDLPSQLSVMRAFWRCCIALRDAEVLEHEGVQERRREKPLHVQAKDYHAACERLFKVIQEGCDGGGLDGQSYADFFRTAMRCVKYSTCGDDGECAFYRRVIFPHFFVQQGKASNSSSSGFSLGQPSSNTSPPSGISSKWRSFMFASLLRSTQRGQQTAITREYFNFFRTVWHDELLAVEEIVVHVYLQTLANARAFDFIAAEAVKLLSTEDRRPYVPSNSVLAIIVRAAGELRKLDLCLQCVELLLGGGSDKNPPSPYEMFAALTALAKCTAPNFFQILQLCTVDSELITLSEEELLYIRLQYVRNSIDARERIEHVLKAVLVDDEMRLSEGRDHQGERKHTKKVGSNNDANVGALSVRNKNLILHILQTCDSDRFMPVLRRFCSQLPSLSDAERSWGMLALFWADGRRHRLSKNDMSFVRELLVALNMNDVASPRAELYRSALSSLQAFDRSLDDPPQSPVFRSFTRHRCGCVSWERDERSSPEIQAGEWAEEWGEGGAPSCAKTEEDLSHQLLQLELTIRQHEGKMQSL